LLEHEKKEGGLIRKKRKAGKEINEIACHA
jgi:hypothetical protein